jgi:hypothetical protein
MRFEQKMKAAGIEFAPSPHPGSSDTYVPGYLNHGGICGHKEACEKEVAFVKAMHDSKDVKGARAGGDGAVQPK